jgi:uncharacterized membrane protein YfcA
MRLDQFEKGAVTLLAGVLVFISAGIAIEHSNQHQLWRDVAYWVMVFGAVVFLVGWGILLHAPILKETHNGRG